MVHAACKSTEQREPITMVEALIIILFLISGAATGWMGVHLLPQELLDDVNPQQVRLGLSAAGAVVGLIAGRVFRGLRQQLMNQVRTMPTDLLISRAVGLILGLLVANLLLAPILLLPLAGASSLVKPLAAILSNVFFGVLGYNLAECTAAPCCACSTPPQRKPSWWPMEC